MTGLAKRAILRSFERFGYVILKEDNCERRNMALFKRLCLGVVEGLGYRVVKREGYGRLQAKASPTSIRRRLACQSLSENRLQTIENRVKCGMKGVCRATARLA